MAKKSAQRRPAPRYAIDPEEESQEIPEADEPEPDEEEDDPARAGAARREEESSSGPKRGDKKAQVAEIWQAMPDATAGQVAAEYQRRTGNTVSLPTVNGAKPKELKKGRSVAAAPAGGGPKRAVRRPAEPQAAPGRVAEAGLTIEDLRRVKQLATQVGGVQRLKEAVDALTELTSE